MSAELSGIEPIWNIIRLDVLELGIWRSRLVDVAYYRTCGRHLNGKQTVLISPDSSIIVRQTPEELSWRIQKFYSHGYNGSA